LLKSRSPAGLDCLPGVAPFEEFLFGQGLIQAQQGR